MSEAVNVIEMLISFIQVDVVIHVICLKQTTRPTHIKKLSVERSRKGNSENKTKPLSIQGITKSVC